MDNPLVDNDEKCYRVAPTQTTVCQKPSLQWVQFQQTLAAQRSWTLSGDCHLSSSPNLTFLQANPYNTTCPTRFDPATLCAHGRASVKQQRLHLDRASAQRQRSGLLSRSWQCCRPTSGERPGQGGTGNVCICRHWGADHWQGGDAPATRPPTVHQLDHCGLGPWRGWGGRGPSSVGDQEDPVWLWQAKSFLSFTECEMASSCQGEIKFTHLLFISSPCQVPAIFDGTRLLVYRLLPKPLPDEGLKVRTTSTLVS